jgi:hypothetical protein
MRLPIVALIFASVLTRKQAEEEFSSFWEALTY